MTSQLIGIRDGSQAPFLQATNFARYFGAMRAGRRFRQPELAATLERIAAGGDREFYEGRTADLLVAQMNRGAVAGLIDRADLARYKVAWREPVQGAWHGYTVITAPPPSSGGIALLQMLTMKQDAAALFHGVELNSPQYLHLVSEIEKRVFADRAQYLGDPDVVPVPLAALIDPAYLARPRGRDRSGEALAAGLGRPRAGKTADHAFLDRGSLGQRGLQHLYAQRLVRIGRGGRGRRVPVER